jgi:hypothetical protein
VALNITVHSYDGVLGFGLTACRRAVPEIESLAAYLSGALAELLAAVRALAATQVEGADTPKKATPAVAERKPARVRAPAHRGAKTRRPHLRAVAA